MPMMKFKFLHFIEQANLGYKQTFPYSEIKLSLEPYINPNVTINGTYGLNSPNKCSIVVVGGKYLKQVDEVMRMHN